MEKAEAELNNIAWIQTDLQRLVPAAGLERGAAYTEAAVAVSRYTRALSADQAEQVIKAAFPASTAGALLEDAPPSRTFLVQLLFGAVVSLLVTGEFDSQKSPPSPPTQDDLDLLWRTLEKVSVPTRSPAIFAGHVLACVFESKGEDLSDEELGDAFESLLRAFFPDQARRLADKPMSVGDLDELREHLKRARRQVEKNLDGEGPAERENILASFDNVDQVLRYELDHARVDAGLTSTPHAA